MHEMLPDFIANQALAVAAGILETRYRDASFAFVAGSIMRGQGTTASDIDIVVIYPSLERGWRESFVADGFPVEAFVHDPTTLAVYLERDVVSGRPVMINLVAEGRIVGRHLEGALALRARARAMLAAGPAVLDDERLETLRYLVSDLADDLRGHRSREEVIAIAVAVYPKLVDLMLLGRGCWTGTGKWMPRRLRAFNGALADRLEVAMVMATRGNGDALLALCVEELYRHGGAVFDGYRRVSEVTGVERSRDDANSVPGVKLIE
ncbi:nucleotidyltransferase domain-containing protein [Devosia sp. CAU 1758]